MTLDRSNILIYSCSSGYIITKKNTCFFFRSDSSNAQRLKFFLNSVLLFSIKCNRACLHSFRHWIFLNFFRLLSIKHNRSVFSFSCRYRIFLNYFQFFSIKYNRVCCCSRFDTEISWTFAIIFDRMQRHAFSFRYWIYLQILFNFTSLLDVCHASNWCLQLRNFRLRVM